jgi:hypothetical protein
VAIKDGSSFNRDAGENNVIGNQVSGFRFQVSGSKFQVSGFKVALVKLPGKPPAPEASCRFLFQSFNKSLSNPSGLTSSVVENIGVEPMTS